MKDLFWEIFKYVSVMTIVILIALTPSVHDNVFHERLRRKRMRNKNGKKDFGKFFKQRREK